MRLGKALREASELFDLRSFKCLDEGKRSLLNRELDKLIHPPSEDETNMLKPVHRYMDNRHAALQPAA